MPLAAYPLFTGHTNSPNTTLSSGITATDTTVPVTELSVFPAAPNLAVIGVGTDAETIYYTGKSATSGAGNLTGVTRQYSYTGTYGVAKAWSSGEHIGRNYTHYDHLSLLYNLTPIAPTGGGAANFTYSQDNNGAERPFYKDDFSNNTIAAYTVTGSPSIAAGVLTMAYGDKIIKTLEAGATAGKWDAVAQFGTAYVATDQYLYLYIGSTSYIRVRRTAGNAIWLMLVINGATVIASTDTTVTLADSTYGRVTVTYDGTNYQMLWNGTNVGAATAGSTPTTPSIGVMDTAAGAITLVVTVNEITYSPSVAFTDPYSADTETRYSQLSSTDLSTWAASAAGDVVVTTGSTKITLASDDDRGIRIALRSYAFASGEYEFAFDNNNDGGGGADTVCGFFCWKDNYNHYKVVLEDNTAGAENLKIYKVVAGTATQIGSTKDVSATYTRGNKTWIKVQYDRWQGRIWVYLRDDAGTYPTTPDISDAFCSDIPYGRFGYGATVTTAGAGNLNVDFFPMTIRANLLIGETNIPATESGFGMSDEFTVNSIGRYITTGTWAVTGGVLSCTGAGNCTLPFQTTIGVHTFTPTLANGTDYYYFGGYRVKFVASGGNTCTVTLETTAGASQGTGSLTVTTVAGLFPAPIIITETSSQITVTVAGSTGTISSGTTTSINAYPKFTVGTATCTFENYSFLGTRYYLKPMLRGAQKGEYHNGTSTITCTRFTDGYNWNTIAEYSQMFRTWSVDTANGYLGASATSGILKANGMQFGSGFYRQKHLFKSVASAYYIITLIGWDGTINGTNQPCNCYRIQHRADTGAIAITYSDATGTGTNISAGDSGTPVANTVYYLDAEWNVATSTITATVRDINGNQLGSAATASGTATQLTSGYAGFWHLSASSTHLATLSLEVNAVESLSTSGIAASISGVPHGARYDTQEEAYITFTNPFRSGEGFISSRAKTTIIASANFEYFFDNYTDTTAINWDGQTIASLTPGLTYVDGLARALFRYQDISDTIKISVRRKNYSGTTYDNQPAVFVDNLNYLPMVGVA